MLNSSTQQSNQPFHILVKPIGAVCNLSCSYCFYLDKTKLYPDTNDFRMSDDILEIFIQNYIWAQPENVRELQFTWQGGEPTLLGIDFFNRAVELQHKYAKPNMQISNAIQTNAVLLDDNWGNFLHDKNFLVGISIDGPQALHDKHRLDSNSLGTFHKVLKGLEILQKYKVEFNTLTVVNRDNADHSQEIYDFLKNLGIVFMQFIPLVEQNNKKKASGRSVSAQLWGTFLNGIFDKWLANDIGKIFIQHFDTFLGLVMGYPSSLCVYSQTCGRAAALEHNGDLYSCDHYVDSKYFLGNIKTKNLADLIDSSKQINFGADKQKLLPQDCFRCEYLKLCNGGCPAHRITKSSDNKQNISHLCKGYKSFFAHSLPYFLAMAQCLNARRPASDFRLYL